ncbi:DUF6427 family protein [Aquimarina sp. ERC-38]|uniref:DUF6427 family protein n=1 Tax=Aquimarina sp. ERC-38 TaxID=2949996 RepID=UPI0022473EF8|nr:DUF6427 family protein [Aquimarina sp. ERC-38]UZO82655.1 DUF6427 family protein [Aquimarina sp. ERC-38]
MFISSVVQYTTNFEPDTVINLISSFFCYLLAMILVNRMVKKNEITSYNTLTIVLFTFLISLFPYGLINPAISIANLFMVLAIYFITSLSNLRYHKSKILNASICVGIATLAYSWCIFTLILIYVGIWYYGRKEYRNWLIPFVGLGVVAMMSLCFHLVVYNDWTVFDVASLQVSASSVNFQFSAQEIFGIASFILCSLFFLAIYIYRFKKRLTRLKPILALFIWYYIVTLLIVLVFAEQKSISILLATPALAIIGTSYLELKQNKLITETTLWVIMLLPFFGYLI